MKLWWTDLVTNNVTNNEKLKIIQKIYKLKALEVARICYRKSESTVWAWRSKPDSSRYRKMNDGEYEHLVKWLVENEHVASKSALEKILLEGTK
ncbi:conserved hypothetical protein [Vibrio nigripulchritudo SOn1]|uniref:Transposase n=1 Tax=Vibrio nigripulchritudo SOn1 TaxID=1238450 RepID=A0AAV2VLT0_9VIBR|nr:hypothetical protein [Vibrio nigripulchritudo]CCO45439.1 conserved hypothetical protein [Vibrio nigripulchritudo SOn1]